MIESIIRNKLLMFTLSFPSVLMSFLWALHCTELAGAHDGGRVCWRWWGIARQVSFSHLRLKLRQAPDRVCRLASGAVTSLCLQIASSCVCTVPKWRTEEWKKQPGWSSEYGDKQSQQQEDSQPKLLDWVQSCKKRREREKGRCQWKFHFYFWFFFWILSGEIRSLLLKGMPA